MLVDSHCHLDYLEPDHDIGDLLARMAANDVSHALCVSVDLENFPKVRALAHRFGNLFASVGVHPDYPDVREPTEAELLALADDARIVAIGETGLDYYRLSGDLEWQRERFRTHIRVAKACGKPLIVHTRAAADDTIRIMREEGADSAGGVMHCFTETWEVARAALDLGFYISFSGILSFKNAQSLRDVAVQVPQDRILVETDSPYLAPVPHRGKTNQPAFVKHVAECMAAVRGVDLARISRVTTDNFDRLFKCL